MGEHLSNCKVKATELYDDTMNCLTKYAEELELSFSDLVLDYSTGLFKLGDTSKAYNHYFTKVEDQIKKADEQLQLYKDNSKDIQWLMTFGDQKTRENNIVAQGLYERLGEKGLKKEEVDSVISEFQNSDYTNFDKWLIDHYQNLSKTLQNALTDAKARAELNTGNITNFVKQAIGVTQDVAEIIASSLIKEGRFNYDAIEKALDDAGKDVDNIDFSFLENYGISIADALGGGSKQDAPAQQPVQQPVMNQGVQMQMGQPMMNPMQMGGMQMGGMQMGGMPMGGMNPMMGMGTPNVQTVQYPNLMGNAAVGEQGNIGLIMDVFMEMTVELGRAKKQIKDILGMGEGTIIELDKLAGEPVDILVNHKPIAKGEVVVIDENFGVRVTEILAQGERVSDMH